MERRRARGVGLRLEYLGCAGERAGSAVKLPWGGRLETPKLTGTGDWRLLRW